MKKIILVVALSMAAVVAAIAAPVHPALTGVAERWKQVPEGMEAPVVLTVPGMDKVRSATVEYTAGRKMDLYYPSSFDFNKPAPVVVFVMGYSTNYTTNWFGAKLKDLGQYVSWGQIVAASGMVGVAYETDYPDDDLETVLRYLQKNGAELGVDSKRIGLFTCSGNTLTALGAMAAKGRDYSSSLRCGVVMYPIISYFMNKGDEVMPAPFKRELRADLPIFMVTVGQDRPEWTEAVDTFLSGIDGRGYPLEVANYAQGIHGFDTDQDTDESKALVAHAVAFMKDHLF